MSIKQGHIWGREGPDCQNTPTPPKETTFLGCSIKQEKDLKIYDLTTANATLMIHQNYVPPTPQHKMFNLAEDWGV